MPLTNQPYLPLYVKDWQTNNKLKLCSPAAHGLLINIMCILHKEEEYGTILLKQKFKQTDNQIKNFALMFARLLPFDLVEIEPALNELIEEKSLIIDGDLLKNKRMIRDAEISEKRAIAGKSGGDATQKNKPKKSNNFAKAKNEANSVNEYENENVNENVNKGNHLFKNSEFFDFVIFEEKFNGTEWEDADLKYYHEAALDWSDSGGNKRKDWIATIRGFMRRDREAGKLKKKSKVFNDPRLH